MSVRLLTRIAVALTVVCALASAPAPVLAGDHENNNGQSGQNSGMSAEQAAALVARAYGGRIVSVKPAGGGYNVRVLLDGGRVKTVQVSANGKLSESN